MGFSFADFHKDWQRRVRVHFEQVRSLRFRYPVLLWRKTEFFSRDRALSPRFEFDGLTWFFRWVIGRSQAQPS
jgi:hypothetical protein